MNNAKKAKKVVFLGLDGADPMIISRFMDEGFLPNLKKVKDMGIVGKDMAMQGAHPTITPPNWASLATGSWPGTHGITCFWTHDKGDDLFKLSYGFNSRLSKAEFVWDAAARAGKKSIVFNYPTGWPPTNKDNLIVIDGSGVNVNSRGYIEDEKIYECKPGDFPVEVFLKDKDDSGTNCMVDGDVDEKTFDVAVEGENIATSAPDGAVIKALAEERVGVQEGKINKYLIPIKNCKNWKLDDKECQEIVLPVNDGVQRRYGLLKKDKDNNIYIEIYKSKKDEKPIGLVEVEKWSNWIYDSYRLDGKDIIVAYKLKLFKADESSGRFNIYCSNVLNLEDYKWFYPNKIGKELFDEIGPMLHMSASGYDEIQLETQEQMHQWYTDALRYLTSNHEWDIVYLHEHALDFANHNYQNKILEEHNPDGYEHNLHILRGYYEIADRFVGRILDIIDEETLLFVVSDHGGMSKEYGCETPLIGDPWSVGGKLLEDLGYMVVKRVKGKAEVDWSRTKAISQRSGYIYINLKGREPYGSVEPEEYEELVEKIIDDLYSYRDPSNNRRPIGLALKKEDMPILGLYGDRVGDIYFTFNSSWTRVHGTQLTTCNYKGTSVNCLFMMAGPGVKKNKELDRIVKVIDIVPTICYLIGIPVPKQAEGGIIYQALEEE